jgi:O-antigen/teichoic acid export membrane protein
VMFIGGAGFLFAIGPWVVGLMYDPRYAEAGTILQILSFSLLFGRFGVSTSAWLALQAPFAQAAMNLVRVVAFFTVVPLAYQAHGVPGAYWAIALHAAACMPVIWWFDRRYGLFSWRHDVFSLAVWPIGWAAGSALVALAAWLAR